MTPPEPNPNPSSDDEPTDPPRPADAALPDMSVAVGALSTLGEYALLEQLGQGGMGTVYRARHTQLDRIVAVKVLPPALVANPDAVSRFRREMKAVGRLDHPNIVRAFDARQIDQTHLLVMEYVDGSNLAELIHRVGPLPVAEACELARQAAVGLEYAHQHGLVHRDVKPSNLMLTSDGRVKLLDLGLARIRSADVSSEMTAPGLAMGTPDYIAPEQVTDSRSVDIRADVYSLGCTLFKLLSGRAPFESSEHQSVALKMTAHVRDPVPPIRQLRSDVPVELADLIARMMAKQPADRPATPQEVADALAPLCRGADLSALAGQGRGDAAASHERPTRVAPAPEATTAGAAPRVSPGSASTPHSAASHRTRWIAGVAGAVLLTIIVALGVQQIFRGGDRQTDAGDTAAGPVSPGPAPPPVRESGQTAPPTAAPSPDWIVLSWALAGQTRPALWLLRPDGNQHAQLTQSSSAVDTEPMFSPDGRHIAFVRAEPTLRRSSIWVCRSDGDGARELVGPTGEQRLMSPVWVSDSRIFFSCDPMRNDSPDMEAWQVDLTGGAARQAFSLRQIADTGAGLITDASPDGSRLLIVAQQPGDRLSADLFTCDLSGEQVETVWSDALQDGRGLWSPDGKRIAWQHLFAERLRGKVNVFGVGMAVRGDDGNWSGMLAPPTQRMIAPVAWSADGTTLLCVRARPSAGLMVQTEFFLFDHRFRMVRELFGLETSRTGAAQRHGGRLADWSTLPTDVLAKLSLIDGLPTP